MSPLSRNSLFLLIEVGFSLVDIFSVNSSLQILSFRILYSVFHRVLLHDFMNKSDLGLYLFHFFHRIYGVEIWSLVNMCYRKITISSPWGGNTMVFKISVIFFFPQIYTKLDRLWINSDERRKTKIFGLVHRNLNTSLFIFILFTMNSCIQSLSKAAKLINKCDSNKCSGKNLQIIFSIISCSCINNTV